MAKARLSVRAEDDLLNLYLYGIETFGVRVAVDYLQALTRCIDLLAENPRMGRPADKERRRLRRFEHRRHVIFYEEQDDGVLVLGIIHERSVRGIGP